MKHFLIISGGSIEDDAVIRYLWQETEGQREEQNDSDIAAHLRICGIKVIAADSGLEFCYRNHILPDMAVGDFDSAKEKTLSWFKEQKGIIWYELNPEKDDTDTEFAIRKALALGAEKITVLGGTGSRLDHVLGNIELLGIGMEAGVPIELVDAHNRIRMIKTGITLEKKTQFGKYVSLIPYTDSVTHLFLNGFKYPLSDACLRGFCSLGISNEIVDKEAEIRFEGGILLVIESDD